MSLYSQLILIKPSFQQYTLIMNLCCILKVNLTTNNTKSYFIIKVTLIVKFW